MPVLNTARDLANIAKDLTFTKADASMSCKSCKQRIRVALYMEPEEFVGAFKMVGICPKCSTRYNATLTLTEFTYV